MGRPHWIVTLLLLELLFAFFSISLAVYLLTLAYGARVTLQWPEVANGYIVAAAILGGLGGLIFTGWLGLRKRKLWGWWVAVSSNTVLLLILAYSTVDDGWRSLDWNMAAVTLLAAILSAILFIPAVRRFYWVQTQSAPLSS